MNNRPSIAIIGSGIAGLSIAYSLKKQGFSPVVLEASSRVGGVIGSSLTDEGYLLEWGPHTLLDRKGDIATLSHELGIGDEITPNNPQASTRYIVKYGRLVEVPASPRAFARTELLSGAAKLRLLAEPLARKADPAVDESLANFICRRFGPEILDYFVDPFIAGTFAGDPRHLSARHAFPPIAELEQRYNSLFLGLLAKGITKFATAIKSKPEHGTSRKALKHSKIISYKRGLQTLIDGFENALSDAIRYNQSVAKVALQPDSQQWAITMNTDGSQATEHYDIVICCIPAHQIDKIDWQSSDGTSISTQPFNDVPYSPIAVVSMGFGPRDVVHPMQGLGFLVPSAENFHILGTFFTSTLFPGRAPAGHAHLTTFVGGARQPELAHIDDDNLVELVTMDLQRLLGLNANPSMVNIRRYTRSIPQYEVGYQHIMSAIDSLEKKNPGLYFAGNYRDGISVPALIASGDNYASRILSTRLQ